MEKVDSSDADKLKWIELEFFMDLDNPASNYSRHCSISKDEFPEE
jgi:hypothetical protein